MPTVHCPGCKRALNLPEDADISTARCPMCQTEFPVLAPPPTPTFPMFPNVPPVPRFTVRQTGSEGRDEPPLPSRPANFDEDNPSLAPVGDKSVTSACTWGKVAGVLSLSHLFCCACVPFVFSFSFGNQVFVPFYIGGYVLQFIAGLMLCSTPTELRRPMMSLWYAWALGVLAMLVGLLTLLSSLPLFFALATRTQFAAGEEILVLLAACFANLVLVITCIVAGLKIIAVARRERLRRDATIGWPDR